MERRERYDPEDIEQLLAERSFDDLLDEERAFVLKHVTDRAEYERMRALLLHVDDEERESHVLDADPSVRSHVLEVFRAQKRPQWRIWLNSVGGFFIPRESEGYWKPALAFGTLALVSTATIIGLQRYNDQAPGQVAELHRQEEPVPKQPEVRAIPSEPASHADALPAEAKAAEATTAQIMEQDRAEVAEDLNSPTLNELQAAVAEEPPAIGSVRLIKEVEAAEATDEQREAAFDADDAKVKDNVAATGSVPHVVTAGDLATNMSSADRDTKALESVQVIEASKRKKSLLRARKQEAAGRADVGTAEPEELMGLLRAAW